MEGSVKAEKIQAMKNYKRAQFLYNLILYSLTSLITCFFFSYSFWFPSIKHLLSSLPDNIFYFSNAKSLFILANLIVFILIGESKLARSSCSSDPASDIYHDYFTRSQIHRLKVINSEGPQYRSGKKTKLPRARSTTDLIARPASLPVVVVSEEKEDNGVMKSEETHHENKKNVYDGEKKKETRSMHHKEKKNGMRVSKSAVWGESEIAKIEKQGQLSVGKEDLNKRVEAFIARVNKQRLLEAKMVDQSLRLKI